MKYALVNPNWTFTSSIYFGCREPHLPLEFGYSQALLEKAGHTVLLIDAQLEGLEDEAVRIRVKAFAPDFLVITTAPSYLFWRCAPRELRVPAQLSKVLRPHADKLVIVGPHGSTTPVTTLKKLRADAVIAGECEEVLPLLASSWGNTPHVLYAGQTMARVQPRASDMKALPPLEWPQWMLAAHKHHHHRFDGKFEGPGAEMEASRGCPYHCTFCAKDNFRDSCRRRVLPTILTEMDDLIRKGVGYVYFIDEIFLPWKELLEAVAERDVKFGMQTRIDLWSKEMLDLLGQAGCVSIEVGVESISEAGRMELQKQCRLSAAELAERLVYAKQRIPFVQANLIAMEKDPPDEVESFRQELLQNGGLG